MTKSGAKRKKFYSYELLGKRKTAWSQANKQISKRPSLRKLGKRKRSTISFSVVGSVIPVSSAIKDALRARRRGHSLDGASRWGVSLSRTLTKADLVTRSQRHGINLTHLISVPQCLKHQVLPVILRLGPLRRIKFDHTRSEGLRDDVLTFWKIPRPKNCIEDERGVRTPDVNTRLPWYRKDENDSLSHDRSYQRLT